MISHEHRFIFVHAARTGGSSIEAALVPSTPVCPLVGAQTGNTAPENKHWSAAKYRDAYPAEFASYYRFGFIRNPWERLISEYEWKQFCGMIPAAIIFADWLITRHHDHQQEMFTENDRLIVDFLGRYEHIQQDFDTVCDRLHLTRRTLPLVNRISDRPHYSTFYTAKTRDYVTELCHWSIDTFGYRFQPAP